MQKQILSSTNSTPSSKNSISDTNTSINRSKNIKDFTDRSNEDFDNPSKTNVIENITARQKYDDSMSYYVGNGSSENYDEIMPHKHKELNLTNEKNILKKSTENISTDSKSFYRLHSLSNHPSPLHIRYEKVVTLYILWCILHVAR